MLGINGTAIYSYPNYRQTPYVFPLNEFCLWAGVSSGVALVVLYLFFRFRDKSKERRKILLALEKTNALPSFIIIYPDTGGAGSSTKKQQPRDGTAADHLPFGVKRTVKFPVSPLLHNSQRTIDTSRTGMSDYSLSNSQKTEYDSSLNSSKNLLCRSGSGSGKNLMSYSVDSVDLDEEML